MKESMGKEPGGRSQESELRIQDRVLEICRVRRREYGAKLRGTSFVVGSKNFCALCASSRPSSLNSDSILLTPSSKQRRQCGFDLLPIRLEVWRQSELGAQAFDGFVDRETGLVRC